MSQNLISNPVFYVRYVDDILAIFNNRSHVNHFLRRLKSNSVLNFTVEHMTNNSFHFLDVNLNINENIIETSVFIKPTDMGTYTNFNSHTLLQYKKSIVKTHVHRALKLSSTWQVFHHEINRMKQIFANNNYPQIIVDQIINNIVGKHYTQSSESNDTNTNTDINIFIELDNIDSFSRDSKFLKNTISFHVKPINDRRITLKPYFKPYKLSSKFSTRPVKPTNERANVVYQFDCPEDGCNASYVGYTTNSLLQRCKQHRYNPSSIYSHYNNDHYTNPPNINSFLSNFKIIQSFNNVIDLKIAEALTIKQSRPYINVKYNEAYNILRLF